MEERDKLVRDNWNLVAFPGSENKFPIPENPNPILPDQIWGLLQNAGAEAAKRLNEIMTDPKFSKLHPKDQLAFIQLALTQAYGAGGAPTKHLHLHASNKNSPEPTAMGNELQGLATYSRQSLPEFKKRRLLNDDRADRIIDLDPADAEPAEHPTGSGD